MARRGKRIGDVATALQRRQAGLRGCGANARQCVNDRTAKLPRKVRSLIESSPPPLRGVQRNGDHTGHAAQNVAASGTQQRAERTRQRTAPLVLQRMDDCPKRAVVIAEGTRPIDKPARAPASRALLQRRADGTPPGQRVATLVAQRRRQRANRFPAGKADRAVGRMLEQFAARRAGRRHDDGQQGVEAEPQRID